ncbi:MAG: alcohol dehydrogenase catalytic domain-containing protein [Elusimicrobiota bacterium]
MLALVKNQQAPGAEISEVPIPRPGQGEVLLKVHRASICGSDLPIYFWTSWATARIKPPLVFGHELCGEVVETAPGADVFKPGDKVAVESHIFCGYCATCSAGDRHLCRRMALVGIDRPGGFAEYVALPERVLWKLNAKLPYDFASLMEPLGNALYATTVEPVEGKTVLILGCGPQGLFAVQVAKAMGAKFVVAVEKSEFRAAMAKKLGADKVISGAPSDKELIEQVLSFDGVREGYDACLEMSGSTFLVNVGFRALRNGGRMSLFGLTAGKTGIDLGEDVIFKGLRIYGILGRKLFSTWEQMEALLLSGKAHLDASVSHVLPLTDFDKAFSILVSPQKACGKILFKIGRN